MASVHNNCIYMHGSRERALMGKSILFEDAIIHTGRTEEETFSSMLVKDGRIVELNPKSANGAKRISLGGKHVYPCLIDGHVHLLYTVVMAGQGFDICTISDGNVVPNTMECVEKKLRAFAANKQKNSVVVGNNYILSAIDERRLPNRRELDEWTGGRPTIIYTIDGHASAVSTAILEKLGIDPKGHDGILMGEAHDRVQGQLTDIIASGVTIPIIAKGIAKFHNDCAKYGISCVGALEGNGDSEKDITTKLIAKLARHFDVDVKLYLQYMDINKALPYSKIQSVMRIGGCGDWEMDGAVGAHSAAFDMAFLDTGVCSKPYYEQDFIDKQVKAADEAGYQISSHAIGNVAVHRIVKALSKSKSGRMHRIEHCEWVNDEDIDIIAEHDFAVMMQPGYSWIDKRYLHTYEQFLPRDMISRMKFKTLCDKGICVCGSSDSPVQTLNPWQQMMGMTQFYREEESVSPYMAFKCYTSNPSRAILEESDRGTLEVGKKADFFITEEDIFKMTPEHLGEVNVLKTYYGGKEAKIWKGTILELISMMFCKRKLL